jgi:DNA-binding CsgD family transcriptional regulator
LSEKIRTGAVNESIRSLLPDGRRVNLTKRESMVMELAAVGKTSQQIAETLSVSRRTAEAHRANLMKKLGLKSQTDLVLFALRKGVMHV